MSLLKPLPNHEIRSCYKIIHDQEALEKFISFLPDLETHEIFMIQLLARAKYNQVNSNLTADKNQLKRFTCNKENMLQKIKQLQCPIGAYEYKGQPINQDNLAVYITLNPRDLELSTIEMMREYLGRQVSGNKSQFNPSSEAMSWIQKTPSRRIFFDVDVDFNSGADPDICTDDFKNQIQQVLNIDCLTLVRTHGGIHCLIKLASIEPKYVKTWYQGILAIKSQNFQIDKNYIKPQDDGKSNATAGLLPIPGLVQGKNFSPHIITF